MLAVKSSCDIISFKIICKCAGKTFIQEMIFVIWPSLLQQEIIFPELRGMKTCSDPFGLRKRHREYVYDELYKMFPVIFQACLL